MPPNIPSGEFLKTLTGFPEGDDNSYPWSTRLPRGGDQFLQDLQAEWGLPNKSVTLRNVVLILYTYIDKLNIDLGKDLKDRLYWLRTKKEKEERDRMRGEIYKTLIDAKNEDYPPLKARLELAAQKMAKRFGLPWPPPEMSITEYDAEANYLLDRLMRIAQKHETNEVTLRELVRHSVFDAETAREVLKKLEEHQCISTREEARSGLPTLVITLPAFSFDEEQVS